MKIDDFNIVPILDGEKIVGFDISIQDKRIEEVGFHIKDGHVQITSITAYENNVIACLEKQGEKKPDDKAEPEFNVGEWIISPGGCYLRILDIEEDGYLCEDILGEEIKVLCEHSDSGCDFKLWTIEDAKDGDVISNDNLIIIFRKIGNDIWNDVIDYYVCCSFNSKSGVIIQKDKSHCGKINKVSYYPATKEQRELLFSKIKESGYEWYAGRKELKKIDNEWVDLGLPSGTLWKSTNEEGYYNYDEAVKTFGDKLPTEEQFKELKNNCVWEWRGNGCKVTGSNGNSIFMSAFGYRNYIDNVYHVGMYGYYWSSTHYDSDYLLCKPNYPEYAWCLSFNSSECGICRNLCCYSQSVHLVKK